MGKAVWVLVLILAIFHWDFWWWNDATLVFGFLPIGLAYHALFSLCAGLVWALAVRFAWPSELEGWASEADGNADGASGAKRS